MHINNKRAAIYKAEKEIEKILDEFQDETKISIKDVITQTDTSGENDDKTPFPLLKVNLIVR